MKNPFLKMLLLAGSLLFLNTTLTAQVSYSAGPALANDRDNKMNRMLGGDETSFYCYRVRSRGRGTSFYVEKYDKASLRPEFSREISLGEEERETVIQDVEYASGNVFVFRRRYNKKAGQMSLFFQTVSASGVINKDLKEVITISSDHYEFVDFDIIPNPGKTKFLIKATHKANKQDTYKTDLILMDAMNIKKLNTRQLDLNLHSGGMVSYSFWGGFGRDSYGFVGLYLDDKDNIFFCMNELIKEDREKKRRHLNLYTLNAGESKPRKLTLPFDEPYLIDDIEFSKAGDQDIVVGGFLTDIEERRGRDLVKCGIFSFKINVSKNTLTGRATQFFDDKMLTALGSNVKNARNLNYKLDYILPAGDAVYYVGEQFRVTQIVTTSSSGQPTSTRWKYEYMDVLVAKLNSKGEFEWIKNVPLRNVMEMRFPHVFKQYIAFNSSKNLYILCNDHPKNLARYEKPGFKPKDLKAVKGIHGSNFVSNAVSLSDGKITRELVFENNTYCFAPIQERNPQFIPPSDCEIFVPGINNDIYIYTEDRGRDKFGRLTFD
jgi:hypothetical protein